MGVATVDFVIGGVVLLVLFAVTGTPPQWAGLVWVGPELFVMTAFSLGITLLIAASVVYLRDIRQTIPLFLQFGLFATPVAYSLNGITGLQRDFYAFVNPLVATIDGLRQSLLFGEQVRLQTFASGLAGALTYLLVGYAVFKKLEPGIADVA
jgi:ABC-2 type transport system permease protein/lipopolysaccharide transport system permease protein